jgi:twinkle protein
MTADYGKLSDSDFYRRQSHFMGQLVEFANRFGVHVHLVAHPRKTSGELTNDDVSGTGDITNRAANVITLTRLKDEECGLILEITKNRSDGTLGKIGLNYDKVSRRIYTPKTGNVVNYPWSDSGGWVEVEIDGNLPF